MALFELVRLGLVLAARRTNTGFERIGGMPEHLDAIAEDLAEAGVTVVTDTCTYITPVLHEVTGPVMTDSGKWAWYAPTNLGFDVALGSLEDCVRSAAEGRVVCDDRHWTG